MDARTWWRRPEAPAWAPHVIEVAATTLSTGWAVWASLFGHAEGVSGRSFLPFTVPLLIGWLAFRRPERPWEAWVWTALVAAALLVAVSVVLPVRHWGIASAAICCMVLLSWAHDRRSGSNQEVQALGDRS